MSHLDEGTLHALLDGELESSEVLEIRAHLGSCAACGSRLREVEEFLHAADRLVERMQPPKDAGAGRVPSGPAPVTAPTPPPPADATLPVKPRPPQADTPPILLIPDHPDGIDRRQRWWRRLGWAASIAIVGGGGYLVYLTRSASMGSQVAVAPSPPGRASPAPEAPESALGRTDAVNGEGAGRALQVQPPPGAPGENRAPPGAGKEAESRPSEFRARDLGVQEEAARALAELDRDRRREVAAKATATLDATRPRRADLSPDAVAGGAVPSTLAPPPAPPTPEQRARTYQRIGLDEANRQLGGPVHVIEGMSPLFVGLAHGSASPGADPTRPVVRVVYQDAQGRLILLDQQRVVAGQAPAAPSTEDPVWTQGGVTFHLQGEVGTDLLQRLRTRVR